MNFSSQCANRRMCQYEMAKRVYLDTNVYCRPLDDQTSHRVRSESRTFTLLADAALHKEIIIVSSDYVKFEIEKVADPLKRKDDRLAGSNSWDTVWSSCQGVGSEKSHRVCKRDQKEVWRFCRRTEKGYREAHNRTDRIRSQTDEKRKRLEDLSVGFTLVSLIRSITSLSLSLSEALSSHHKKAHYRIAWNDWRTWAVVH